MTPTRHASSNHNVFCGCCGSETTTALSMTKPLRRPANACYNSCCTLEIYVRPAIAILSLRCIIVF